MKSKQQLYSDYEAIKADINRLKDHLEFINAIKITNENREQIEKDRQAIFENIGNLHAELLDTLECISYYNVLEKHKGEL